MAVNLSPFGGVGVQFFDNSGNPLTGGKIFTYTAGTTTPQTTYTTSAGSTAHSNPIILDAGGRVPSGGEIWLTDGLQYKFLLKDANDVQIASYDNIVGINSNFVAYSNSQEIQTATAGQTVFTLTTMQYQLGTDSLSVFVDGVNQYGPGAQYAYVETNSTTITFTNGLHVGASVKFTTSQLNTSGGIDANQVSYDPPFSGSQITNVEAKLAQTVSIKDFGAVGDGIADDTAAFTTCIATFTALDTPVQIDIGNGTYKLTSGLVYDPYLIQISGSRGILDFSALTSGPAIHLSSINSANGRPGVVMSNIIIVGPGISSNVYGIYLHSTVGGTPNMTFVGVSVKGFGYGHLYGDNVWTVNWYGCYIDNCGACIYAPGGNTNSGENVVYDSCNFFNSNNGFELRALNWDVYFKNCSFDGLSAYCVYQTASQIVLINCHFESGGATPTNPPFYIDQTGGDACMRFFGGEIILNCSLASYLFTVGTTANSGTGVLLDGTFINFLQLSGNYLATGNGDFIIQNTFTNINNGFLDIPPMSSAKNTLALDGSFETGLQDDISISLDTAPITSRTNGTSLDLARSNAQAHTGTWSLAATRNAVAGNAASFQIAYPLDRRQSRIGMSLWYNVPGGIPAGGAGSGEIYFNLLWAGGEQYNSDGVPTFTRQELPGASWQFPIDNSNYSAGGWTEWITGNTGRAPSWATHALIVVNMNNWVGSAVLYLDDIVITTM